MHTNSVNGKMYETDILELKIDKNTSKIGGRRHIYGDVCVCVCVCVLGGFKKALRGGFCRST